MPRFPQGTGPAWDVLNATGLRKNAFLANRAPMNTDDVNAGYERGSQWFYGDQKFTCRSNLPGNAEWVLDDATAAMEPPFTPFASRQQFLTTPIYVDISAARAVQGGAVYDYIEDPAGPIIGADSKRWRPAGSPRPQHFGAVGDGVTDDTDAMEAYAAYTGYLRSIFPQRFALGEARYLISRPIAFTAPSGGFRCVFDLDAGEFLCNFNRTYSQDAFITFGDPSSPSTYQGGYRVEGRFLLRKGPACQYAPVGFRCYGPAQTTFGDFDSALWDNMVLELRGPQNVTIRDLILYFGGHSFGYRDASGSLFRRTGTTLNRVSGGFAFQASDVGKTIKMIGTNQNLRTVITAYNSPTSVEVDASGMDTVDRGIRFGSPAPSVTSGSPVIALDGDDPLLHKEGLTVAIPRAGDNGKILVGKVVSVDAGARTLTLDRNAGATLDPAANPLTDTTEIATPCVGVFSDLSVYPDGISQVRWYNLQIESFSGVGLLVDDAEKMHFFGAKIHGKTAYTWDSHPVAALWANRIAGSFIGELGGQYFGRRRMQVGDQTQTFNIVDFTTRLDRGEKLLHIMPKASTSPSALVTFDTLTLVNTLSTQTITDFITDENSPIRGYSPPITFIKPDQDDTTYALGPSITAKRNGFANLKIAGYDAIERYNSAGLWTPQLTDSNPANIAGGVMNGGWERIGNILVLNVRMSQITTTGLGGGQALVLRNLPAGVRAHLSYVNTAIVRCGNITAASPVMAYCENGGSVITFWMHNSGGDATPLNVSALTSGSASMRFSMTFISA